MGSDRPGSPAVPLVAQVVPAVPTFAVDDGFAYAVPADFADDLRVGSVVRVPLGGRRVRGYVVDVRDRDVSGLKEVAAVSGHGPVFDGRLLQTLRWAAVHYVAPLAALLAKAAPPNLPRRPGAPGEPPGGPWAESPLPAVTGAAAAGRHPRPSVLMGPGPATAQLVGLAGPVLKAGRSVLVVAPTLAEARSWRDRLGAAVGEARLGSSGIGAKEATAAWSAAQAPGRLLVGTRETAFWPMAGLALAVILGDGRRGMKDKATPTTHARDVLRRRASIERFGLVVAATVPTVETIGIGPDVAAAPGRHWPLVEVADRTEEPPGGGFLLERTRLALRGLVNRGGTALVFTHRRGYAPAFRCIRCRTIRRCPACGARPEPGTACVRCGAALEGCAACGGRRFEPLGAGQGRILDEVRRVVGRAAAGDAESAAPVKVATERDLVGLQAVELAVVVDADGLFLAPHYRSDEDAFRLLVRVAQTVAPGRGRRCLVQTSLPGHAVLAALRHGQAGPYLDELAAARARDGFPPAGELIVVEATDPPPSAHADLEAATAGRGEVLGPAEVRDRRRWLLQGRDLWQVRVALRRIVSTWRETGARVRIDADPVDL